MYKGRSIQLILMILVFSCEEPLRAAAIGQTYYIDQTSGNDSNNGTSPSTPWKNAPGMTTCASVCANTVLQPGSTVYFDRDDVWLVAGGTWDGYGLHVKGGVTYIGDSWEADGGTSGTRATIRAVADLTGSVIDVREDHATLPTIVKGFDVDGNGRLSNGVGVGFPFCAPLIGATKRLENLNVHNTWSRTSLGQYTYGIIVSNHCGDSGLVENVEILSSVVHDVSRDAIVLYPGDENANCAIRNITVRGNEVYNTGTDPDFAFGSGITTKGNVRDAFIENNYVHNTEAASFFVNSNETNHFGFGPSNIHIRYNITTNNTAQGAILLWDGSSGSDPKDVKIYGNIVYNSTFHAGFLIDTSLAGTNNVLLYNNTFYNASVVINNTAATFPVFEFKNNIVYFPGGTPITGSNRFTASSNNVVTNPFFKNTGNLPAGFSGTLGIDFSPASDGLSVTSGSPALDAGSTLAAAYNGSVNGLTRPQGSMWDIGAYESSGTAPTSDTVPPTIALNSPANPWPVGGTSVAVLATASDNVGVVGVQFKLDGANLGGEDLTAPYSFAWNTTTTTNGSHNLTAVARDASGNQMTSTTVVVTVDNIPPTISLSLQ